MQKCKRAIKTSLTADASAPTTIKAAVYFDTSYEPPQLPVIGTVNLRLKDLDLPGAAKWGKGHRVYVVLRHGRHWAHFALDKQATNFGGPKELVCSIEVPWVEGRAVRGPRASMCPVLCVGRLTSSYRPPPYPPNPPPPRSFGFWEIWRPPLPPAPQHAPLPQRHTRGGGFVAGTSWLFRLVTKFSPRFGAHSGQFLLLVYPPCQR